MKHIHLPVLPVLIAAACLAAPALPGAEPIVPDLRDAARGIGWKPAGRPTLRWETGVKGKDALFAQGVVWLDGLNFTDGTIECDILGKGAPRGSNFLGLAFRGADDATYDCVYFRPFNFRAPSPENSNHAVQYISHPQWTWPKLRAERTGRYEKPLVPPPDGDAWLRAKIVIAGKTVRVFVNGAEQPALEVEMLHDRAGGRIGIWGGDAGVGGHFANLKITPASGGGRPAAPDAGEAPLRRL
jgi:hypothetical protein